MNDSSRNRVELFHQISVLANWATSSEDTVSALSETQAKKATQYLMGIWPLIERRKGSR